MEEVSHQTQKVFCCPSKVLIMGGYAILSEQCVGLSVGLNEKFYAYITVDDTIYEKQEQKIKYIKFISRQIEQQWTYKVNLNNKSYSMESENEVQQNKNPFLESVVQVLVQEGINELSIQLNQNIIVNIYHDNRFYSSASKQQDQNSSYFWKFDKINLHKTGLGSSACVLVVTLGTLLKYYNEFTEEKLHCLSQKANFFAQKKIGSGFDISTSVFGSQVYKRFPPEIFSSNTQYKDYKWDQYVRFNIPKELKVMMIDLSIGSDTRVLAGEIKKYIDSHPDDAKEFHELNNICAQKLQQIFSGVQNLQSLKEQKQNIIQLNKQYRSIFKSIGKKANVETEPDDLSKILDQITQEIPEVYYGVCPGAGGYDALCLLTENTLSLEDLQIKIMKIKGQYENIKDMIAQEIDISLQGFHQLDQVQTKEFQKNIFQL